MIRLAKFISILSHPLFILFYILLILIWANPYLFGIHDDKMLGLLIISTFFLTTFFPGLSIVLMKTLGMIQSLGMKSRQERTGPLIATAIFYLWLYVNIKSNPQIPIAFSFVVLGTIIAIFLSFFINIFQKVSLHGVGMGGFLFGILIISARYSYGSFLMEIPHFGLFEVSMLLVLAFVFLSVGMVLTSRLILKVHTREEIFGGLFIGMVSQFIAFVVTS